LVISNALLNGLDKVHWLVIVFWGYA